MIEAYLHEGLYLFAQEKSCHFACSNIAHTTHVLPEMCDPSFQNGLNALHLASKEGHVEVVAELLKLGANVDAATKVSPAPPTARHSLSQPITAYHTDAGQSLKNNNNSCYSVNKRSLANPTHDNEVQGRYNNIRFSVYSSIITYNKYRI